MPVKPNQVKKSVRNFYNRSTAHGSWLLAIMLVVIGLALTLPPALAALTPGAVVVDDKVKVSFSGLRLNRSSNTFDSLATLTNQSAVPIAIPVQLAISTISSPTVTLANATGIQSNGAPYVNVPLSDGVLDPGETVSNILLKFNNPQKTAFTFKHSVFGRLPKANHPPKANAGGDQGVPVGAEVTLNGIHSTDEDGDSLTYRWHIVSQPATNPTQLGDTTAIAPKLVINNKGSYQIELIVNDGQVDSQPALVVITTENSKPVAAAGDDQTVFVQTTAQLDGVNSKDRDEDNITYQWQLIAKPTESKASLQNETTQTPSLTPDKPGDYTVELIVNDGVLNSDPDRVIISTQNSRPVADAGPNQQATAGTPVTLDGLLSRDVDDDPLSFVWSLLNKPANSSPVLQNTDQAKATLIPDLPGDYISQLIVNDGHANSDPATALVTVSVAPPLNQPPQMSTRPVLSATVDQNYSYAADATDSDNDTLTYSLSVFPTGMSINAQSGLIGWTPAASQTGPQSVTVNVIDGKGGSDSQSFTVTVAATGQITVPDVGGLSRTAAETAIQQAQLTLGTPSFQHDATADGNVINQSPAANSSVAQGTAVNLTISLGPDQGLPPNPATVAPALDATVATTTYASTQFLYSGSNPIQTLSNGQPLAQGTIDAKRAAVIRGKVLDKQNNPLSGVTVSIKYHPELGQTLSRADGQYDMAVNGGGLLTVNYSKAGYLNAQRQANPAWQDYQGVDDVVLIAKDVNVTTVDLTAATPMQIARGSSQTDANGTRQATVLIPEGTQAQIFQPDGTTVPVTHLNLRLTEYTVGANGPKAMPGPLPPTSGYTYAVEIGADEANVSVAGKEILFSQPVYFYVENFLGFPVGIQVPVGYYDKDKSAWIPSNDGRIVKITGITGGLADLDTNGDTIADNNPGLGITAAERAQLAATYSVGQSLERVPLDHFSTYDPNYGISPAVGSTPPKLEQPKPDKLDKPECATGSVIECENQTLGETLDITGTPFSLNYRSDQVLGRKSNTLQIPLSGATVPGVLQRIDLELRIAGRVITQSFPVTANQSHTFTWDGLDVYGRPVTGMQTILVRIGYVYPAFYNMPPGLSASFGAASGQRIPGNIPARQPATLWQAHTSHIGQEDARKSAQAGWHLSAHHRYDPVSRMLYQGDGGQRSVLGAIANNVITTVAGNGTAGFSGDGGPATQAALDPPVEVAVAANGSFYISDTYNHRVRRVDSNGIITTVAGNGTAGFSGDGGLATQAALNYPSGIALGTDGNLYISDQISHRIRRVGPDGIITTVAGNGTAGFSGDGGPAAQASLNRPIGIAVGADGSLYIAEWSNHRIRRVGADGIITTVAGNGTAGFSGDGGPAAQASLYNPWGLAADVDGGLYIGDYANHRVRRVGPDGIITTVAGNGTAAFSGDGGPATQAALNYPIDIAVGADGSLYIGDASNHRVRRVGPNGIITTVAGNGSGGFSGDGGPATQALFSDIFGLAVGTEGSLYISDLLNYKVRRVSPVLPGFNTAEIAIPSEDGTELYLFDPTGRHLATLNALTGATLLSFSYDAQGRLSKMTDGDGLMTQIERDALGNPTAIVAPFGQHTTLALDSNGYLAKVTNPAGESHEMAYTAAGLLTSFKDPRGNASTFTYDTFGRLLKDVNAGTGSLALSRTELADGHAVSLTSTLNRVTTHAVRNLSTGDRERKHTQPDNTTSTTLEKTDGTFTTTEADGTLTTLLQGPDPRFSMLAPITQSLQTSTGGLTANLSSQRTAVLANTNNPLSLTKLTESVTFNGRTRTTVYDAASKTYTSTSPAARQSKAVIDSLGRVTQTQATGILPINNSYDPQGRPATIAQGSGVDERLVNFTYNPQGYLASVTDPIGRQVKYEYDLAGRVTRQVLPDNREILYSYDANGNLASLTPPGQPAHLFNYTGIDQTSKYLPPDVSAGTNNTVYTYDKDKALVSVARPDGQSIDINHDSAGRVSSMLLNSANQTLASYAYDTTTGKLTGVTAPDGGLGYTYNGALLTKTTWTGAVSGNVGYGYDNDFRVTSVSLNDANPIAYSYDADSLLTKAGNLTLTRNTQNGLLTGTALGSLTDSFSYSSFGELAGYEAKYLTSSHLKLAYTRDKLGRITQKQETRGGVLSTYDYGYDTAGRLVEVQKNNGVQASYSYDDNGNRLSRTTGGVTQTGTYDAQDRLLTYNGAGYSYTANGELQTKTVAAAVTSYDYDVLGNLKKVVLPGGAMIEYLTDGQNRRIGKKVNGSLAQALLWQGQLQPIAELDGSGNVVSRFVYATDVNVPEYMIKGGLTYRIIKDHLGSPRVVVDIATNTVAQEMEFDEFGRVILDTNPGFQPFGFAGGLYDKDTGLVRFGARDYDAGIGRWVSKDPIGFGGVSSQLYEYSNNNPVSFSDPQGRYAGILIGGGIRIIGGRALGAVAGRYIARQIGGYVGKAIACALVFYCNTSDEGADSSEGEAAGSCPVPDDLAGKTPEEIDEMMKNKGWKGGPTRGEGGTRYPNPDKRGEQVRIQPGNPNDPNPVKRGPYGRISTGGETSPPIPIAGNPTIQ